MTALRVYCCWCNEHAFTVDENTVHTVLILTIVCPNCETITTIASQPGGNIAVIPGEPNSFSRDPGTGKKRAFPTEGAA